MWYRRHRVARFSCGTRTEGVFFFDSPEPPGPENHPVALDEALGALEQISPRQARVIELRFFGGLSHEETAEVLQVSAGTVKRDWTLARASLYCELVKSERGN
jgi:DNA-directed RNA polymerase specialized sigma24 family protein